MAPGTCWEQANLSDFMLSFPWLNTFQLAQNVKRNTKAEFSSTTDKKGCLQGEGTGLGLRRPRVIPCCITDALRQVTQSVFFASVCPSIKIPLA